MTTIGFVQGPSADRAIGDKVLEQTPSIPYRHLAYRVGQKNNDIWNLHSHAGPVGTQSPIPPETDPYKAYARIFTFNSTDTAAQAAIKKRLAKKQSALDLVMAEAAALRGRVGVDDRAKLDLHMSRCATSSARCRARPVRRRGMAASRSAWAPRRRVQRRQPHGHR